MENPSDNVAFLSSKLAPLRIAIDDIVSATDNFSKKNFIKRGHFTDIYKGKLLLRSKEDWIDVVIRRYLPSFRLLQNEFLREIQKHSDLINHTNTLPIVGFCDENGEKIMVFEYQQNGSLEKYITDPTALTWSQKLKICLGAASFLRHVHENIESGLQQNNGFDHEIKSSKILLDKDWEARVFCFGFDIRHYVTRINLSFSRSSYTDPEYNGSHMSDVYAFGVILFEVICGKKAAEVNNKDGGSGYDSFVRMVKKHYEDRRTLNDIINPDLRKQKNRFSLPIVSEIAYNCVQEGSKRPSMNRIVEGLEQALYISLKEEKLMEIQLDVILSATNKFDETCCIGKGGYGKVYKAQLYLSEIMNDDKLPRYRTTVAIKHITRKDEIVNKEFRDDLEFLHGCDHPNILHLFGFCVEGERILVCEYASNGSLDDYLESVDKIINLTWDQRLKMCLGIANGLNYLHKAMGDKRVIIHRDIKSGNILLDENLEVKIADFGLSIFHPTNNPESTIYPKILAGTPGYADPEYMKTGKLRVESDIYSFGVVLFEILSGKLAYDPFYTNQHEKGLAPTARKHFNNGTIMELVDARLMNEAHELSSTLKLGPDKRSLVAFCEVASKCLAKTQVLRPKMNFIIEELVKALHFQENRKDTLKMSFDDIKFEGETVGDNSCNITRGLGMVYNGECQYNNGCKEVVVEQLRRSILESGICREFEIPFKRRHENIVDLVGYCKTMDEKFIVYEHASNQSLDLYLNDADFSWTKRLKICTDIAKGLDFLHKCDAGQEVVIHRDLKSSNILLTGDWKAKISGFEHSVICPTNQDKHFLTKESDIYSFGVILFEVLCGRSACHEEMSICDSAKHQRTIGKLDDIVFDGIKKQIVQKSLVTFQRIAIQCLNDEIKERPTAGAILEQLQKALEYQEDIEIWKNKLPVNYIDILKLSKSPEIYFTMWKKDIYNMFTKGISLQDGKLWFSIGSNEERKEIISATTFLYKNRWSRRWQSIQISRFKKVAEMLDVANLNIHITKSTKLLLPDVKYNVHLVFKFCYPRKSHADRMYVNLKYKMGNQNLNAYFATMRNDKWLMIELCRFSNQKEETNVDILLESFTRCYCDSRAIYIEGIEFQALDNVKQEEIKKSENNEQVSKKRKFDEFSDQSFEEPPSSSVSIEVPAEQVLYDTSNKKLSLSSLSFQSRSEGEGIELPRQQVFRIKCNIGSQMGSPNTKVVVCYLVFKLSDKCRGLHCPVIVRDQSNWGQKETGILYFRSPSPWNLVATDRVPKKRGDGWMEVIVAIFNSDCRFLNLKLSTYEGTMSGLILRSLEFRPS